MDHLKLGLHSETVGFLIIVLVSSSGNAKLHKVGDKLLCGQIVQVM